VAEVGEICVVVLEPYIGRMVADTVVRATALSLGKPMDELCVDDLPALARNVRRVLEPVTTHATVDEIVRDIEMRVQ
jgi:hypothetical protein